MNQGNKRFALAIHAGAGAFSNVSGDDVTLYLDGLREALETGRRSLLEGKDSMTAVIDAVRTMEDNPMFNSGKGSVFTHEGEHELDAAVMNGKDLACGAVAGVRTVKNPVLLAQAVMNRLPHVFLAGKGADDFAASVGLETVSQEYYFFKKRYEQWQEALKSEGPCNEKMGTVGAVALDCYGNLAAATSTGGVTNKKFGRVGDSPVIGAGTYANNASCAISCTGRGEDFIRAAAAYDIHALMVYKGLTLQAAANSVINEKLPKGSGGLIGVDREGQIVLPFNSHGMLRGQATSDGVFEVSLY